MMKATAPRKQRGVITIFITIVMLLLVTVMVVTAYSLSTMNLRSVGNLQSREEAIAAANLIIEVTVDSPFYTVPTAVADQAVDINNDNSTDFLVNLAEPRCVRAMKVASTGIYSVQVQGMAGGNNWNTVWELEATARDETTGTSVTVLHAVRILMNSTQKNLVCT
jgi:Tfp pilus assembly protein PilX